MVFLQSMFTVINIVVRFILNIYIYYIYIRVDFEDI